MNDKGLQINKQKDLFVIIKTFVFTVKYRVR